MVENVAVLIRANVRIDQPKLAVLDKPVRILQVGAPATDGFDFGAAQSDARFELLQQKIVVRRSAIDRGIPLTAGGRIAPGLLLLVLRTITCLRLTSHVKTMRNLDVLTAVRHFQRLRDGLRRAAALS